jgi:hypothetical protein
MGTESNEENPTRYLMQKQIEREILSPRKTLFFKLKCPPSQSMEQPKELS